MFGPLTPLGPSLQELYATRDRDAMLHVASETALREAHAVNAAADAMERRAQAALAAMSSGAPAAQHHSARGAPGLHLHVPPGMGPPAAGDDVMLCVIGGLAEGPSKPLSTAEAWHPSLGWRHLPDLSQPRAYCAAALTVSSRPRDGQGGVLYALGGSQGGAPLDSVEALHLDAHISAMQQVQTGGGHMSPIAAYDASTDTALVLDVARYRYPPSWISLATLFASMATTDADAQASRGWIELGGALGIPTSLPRGSPAAATGINGTVSRACMAGLADPNNVAGIQLCLSAAAVGVSPAPPPPPRPPRHPAASCPPAAPASSGGGGFLTVWAVVASMSVFMMAVSLRHSRQELRTVRRSAAEQPHQQPAAYVAPAGAVSIEMNGQGTAEHDTAPLLSR